MRWRLAWLLCTWMGVLVAQEFRALEGTVRDVSGAVVPNTTVTCIQDEEGYRFAAVTDREGRYRFAVPEGHYNVVARRSGFRAVAKVGVYVEKEGLQNVDFVLGVNPVSESVTVSGYPVRTSTAADDAMVVPAAESGTPQNGRTITGLAMTAPGMLATPANSGEPGQISSQGARPNSNSYVVDGIYANNAVSGGGWPSFLPGTKLPSLTALGTTHDLALLDGILQVDLHPHSSAPEFGFTPGAIIAIQTRSGSNEIHGSLFQSLRPDALAANDWFDNRFGLGPNTSRMSNQGFSVGGPLRRERTFFFLAGERLRLQQTYTWTATRPLAGCACLGAGQPAVPVRRIPKTQWSQPNLWTLRICGECAAACRPGGSEFAPGSCHSTR